MKKFLSLVLALVMTMSLVTISAGAKDFTDDDKVLAGQMKSAGKIGHRCHPLCIFIVGGEVREG